MGQARAEMIPFVENEDLGLVCEPPERGRMDDTIAVPAKGIAVAVDWSVVPRSQWQTTLADGARVEVVTAVQGG